MNTDGVNVMQHYMNPVSEHNEITAAVISDHIVVFPGPTFPFVAMNFIRRFCLFICMSHHQLFMWVYTLYLLVLSKYMTAQEIICYAFWNSQSWIGKAEYQ